MDGCWSIPGSSPPLLDDAVQLWRIDLAGTGASSGESKLLVEGAATVLSLEERQIAARMRVGGPAEEFMVARGCLRRLLGAALRCGPSDIVLEKGPHGKPFVRARLSDVAPWFNVAHSHGIILIGLSRVGEIGVDVEFVDPSIDLEGVARTAFHVDEVARVDLARTLEERLDVFYRCWARKEALTKADGRGLTLEPTTYVAGLEELGEQCVTLPGSLAGDRFFVREIGVGSSHRAAVATRVANVSMCTYQMPMHFSTIFPA